MKKRKRKKKKEKSMGSTTTAQKDFENFNSICSKRSSFHHMISVKFRHLLTAIQNTNTVQLVYN